MFIDSKKSALDWVTFCCSQKHPLSTAMISDLFAITRNAINFANCSCVWFSVTPNHFVTFIHYSWHRAEQEKKKSFAKVKQYASNGNIHHILWYDQIELNTRMLCRSSSLLRIKTKVALQTYIIIICEPMAKLCQRAHKQAYKPRTHTHTHSSQNIVWAMSYHERAHKHHTWCVHVTYNI